MAPGAYSAKVCVFYFGVSRSLFGIDLPLVIIEMGEASLISFSLILWFFFLNLANWKRFLANLSPEVQHERKIRQGIHVCCYHSYWLQLKWPWTTKISYNRYSQSGLSLYHLFFTAVNFFPLKKNFFTITSYDKLW